MTATPPKIIARSKRLPSKQRAIFDRIFQSGGGDVLDFSIKTMTEWFDDMFGIEIFQPRFQIEGTSKGKTLRGFVETAEPRLVAKVLRALWDYRALCPPLCRQEDPAEEERLRLWLEQFTAELEQLSSLNLEDAIRDFSGDTTLAKLRASIAADLIAENPDVALDRVHTYCVKRLRHLLAARGVETVSTAPLDTLFGLYGRSVRDSEAVSEFALPMLRIQHKIFEFLNQARNHRSLAHDNQLLDPSEARFVIECVLASLAFIERIETPAPLTSDEDDLPF
jgi:hypothetical protein